MSVSHWFSALADLDQQTRQWLVLQKCQGQCPSQEDLVTRLRQPKRDLMKLHDDQYPGIDSPWAKLEELSARLEADRVELSEIPAPIVLDSHKHVGAMEAVRQRLAQN